MVEVVSRLTSTPVWSDRATPLNVNATRDLLIVGLGNPGLEYRATRHNIGYECVDAFAQRIGVEVDRRRWHAKVGWLERDRARIWVLKPQTYMNESGRTVKEALRDLNLDLERLWVVHDELDLPLGRMRIRIGGSAAGHNGIRSIISSLGGRAGFVRFRVGVGKPPEKGREAGIEHVLGRFERSQAGAVEAIRRGVGEALETALTDGLERAMDHYNRPRALLPLDGA